MARIIIKRSSWRKADLTNRSINRTEKNPDQATDL